MALAIDQNIIDLYDDFTHSRLDRRSFLERLAQLTGSVAAAMAILPMLGPNYAAAAIVGADDNRLETKRISIKGVNGDIKCYEAKPKGAGKLGAVIVIHENRGLTGHIEDVARRIALEGFVAVAPDLLSPLGGTPPDMDQARDMIGKLNLSENTQNLVAMVQSLEKNPETNGKVGVVGFCWGGAAVNQLAVHSPDLDAAVPYYGRVPSAEDVAKIRAPIMAHYGALDKNINQGIPGFEEALKKNNKTYSIFVYDGANHAFNNDTGADRYNKPAADLAWKRTIDFLKENLKA
jgi:carboxymethylenebutenolidase